MTSPRAEMPAAEIARGVAFTGVRRCTPVASVHQNATRSSKKSAIPTITEPLRLVARATLFGKPGGGAPSAAIPVSAVQRNACGAPEASKLAPTTTRPSLERARPWEEFLEFAAPARSAARLGAPRRRRRLEIVETGSSPRF